MTRNTGTAPLVQFCCTLALVLALPPEARCAKPAAVLNMGAVGPRTETVASTAYRRILHVSSSAGSDEKGAGTRDKPWRTIPFALGRIEETAASNQVAILCAAARYDTGTLFMKPYVDLFGGFEPEKWDRDIFRYPSTLDRRGVRRVVVGASHARIDGFVITRGMARYHGRSVLCDDTSPLISNNIIADNLVLEPENFNPQRIHQSGHFGGGIASLFNATPAIRNNLLFGNRTSVGNGGAVAFYGWLRLPGVETAIKSDRSSGGQVPVLENNVLVSNQAGANDTNRTRNSNGGGVSSAHEARMTIRNNVISGNQALGRGDAGGIYVEFYPDPWIVGNWVLGNSCEDDGAVFIPCALGKRCSNKLYLRVTGASAAGLAEFE